MPFFHMKPLKLLKITPLRITPRSARYYLFFAVMLLVLPTAMMRFLPSHSGKILVASGAMGGGVFEHSLIYMTQHHGYGGRGYILNVPLQGAEAAALMREFPLARRFYYGGPVDTGGAVALMLPDSTVPSGYIFVDARQMRKDDPQGYNALVRDAAFMAEARVFSGYAGWGAFQLNREIVRGAWGIVPFDPAYLGEGTRRAIWLRAMEKMRDEKKIDGGIL